MQDIPRAGTKEKPAGEAAIEDAELDIAARIKKQLGSMSAEQLLQYLDERGVVSLIDELHLTAKDIKQNILPLEKVDTINQFMPVKGVGYVTMKSEILQSYVIAIMYYLLLINQNIDVRNHPILAQLTELKKMVNIISQIDESVQGQLEKFIDSQIARIKPQISPRAAKQVDQKAAGQNQAGKAKAGSQRGGKKAKINQNILRKKEKGVTMKTILDAPDEEDDRIMRGKKKQEDAAADIDFENLKSEDISEGEDSDDLAALDKIKLGGNPKSK